MILFNLTFCVSTSEAAAFQKFIKAELDALKLSQAIIIDIKCYKILTDVEPETTNLSVQFFFNTQFDYLLFNSQMLPDLLNTIDALFRGQYAYFPTFMEQF